MDITLLFPAATLAAIKAKIAGFAAVGGLIIDAWQAGDPGEQFFEALTQGIEAYTSNNAQAIRGRYLSTATDPGDYDPFNPENETLDPEPGALSALGLEQFFTERPGASAATLTVTFANASAFAAGPFAPGAFTIAKTGSPEITYRNASMAGVYTGPGGTYSIPAGGSGITLDFIADSPGSASNADANQMTLVTQFAGVTITAAGAAVGADRMSPDNYRALCRTQASTTAPNGTVDAYLRWSRLNRDGTPLLNSSGTAVGITKVQATGSSATGAVNLYYADDDGGAISIDVTAANTNIQINIVGVGDTITFTGAAATNTGITVTWAVEYSPLYLGQAVTGPVVKAAIVAAVNARFRQYPIGGYKQTAGAGSISLEEIRSTVKSAHPAISDATLSSPVGTTAIALGHVPHLTAATGTETAV